MTLYDICMEIALVQDGLAFGEVDFCYDNLMSALKPGHPADILDEIVSPVVNAVYFNQEVTIEQINELLQGLNDFQQCFKVDLQKPIKALKQYLKEKAGGTTNG